MVIRFSYKWINVNAIFSCSIDHRKIFSSELQPNSIGLQPISIGVGDRAPP